MSNYATLIASIQSVITQNGNNEITGLILQDTLLALINSLGSGYQFVGIATPATNPGTPDQRVFYIASSGTYPNFGPATIPDGNIVVFYYDTSWHYSLCEITAKFASNQVVNNVHVVNDLTNGGANDVLSAEQGKALKTLIDGVKTIINSGFVFMGVATPATTNPTDRDLRPAWIASEAGTYTNLNGYVVNDGEIVVITRYTNALDVYVWNKVVLGTYSTIELLEECFKDITKNYNAIATLNGTLNAWAWYGGLTTPIEVGIPTGCVVKNVGNIGVNLYTSTDGTYVAVAPDETLQVTDNYKYIRAQGTSGDFKLFVYADPDIPLLKEVVEKLDKTVLIHDDKISSIEDNLCEKTLLTNPQVITGKYINNYGNLVDGSGFDCFAFSAENATYGLINMLNAGVSRIYGLYSSSSVFDNTTCIAVGPSAQENEGNPIKFYVPSTAVTILVQHYGNNDEQLYRYDPVNVPENIIATFSDYVSEDELVDGFYINGSGNKISFAGFKLHKYNVSAGEQYVVHNSQLTGSGYRKYACYSVNDIDDISSSNLTLLGEVSTDSEESYNITIPNDSLILVVCTYQDNVQSVEKLIDEAIKDVVVELNGTVNNLEKDVADLKGATSFVNKYLYRYSGESDGLFEVVYNDGSGTEYFYIFKKCMANNLYTFYRVAYRETTRNYPVMPDVPGDLTGWTVINSTTSDNIGPIGMANGGWVGGNHHYPDETTTPNYLTATCAEFKIYIDNTLLNSGASGLCENIVIVVNNIIFDPAIAPSPGATSLSTKLCDEIVRYSICKNTIEVALTHKFVGTTTNSISVYYGMQSMFNNESKILTPNGQYSSWLDVSGSTTASFKKEDYPNFNRFIEYSQSNGDYQSTYLYSNGLGNHNLVGANNNIFTRSSGKDYHQLINNLSNIANKCNNWNGSYTFFHTPIVNDEYVFAYWGTIHGKLSLFINTLQAYEGYVPVPSQFGIKNITAIEHIGITSQDDDYNFTINGGGVYVKATGTGSLILQCVDGSISTGTVMDVTVGGTSVVSNGIAVIPPIPTVPIISTNIDADKNSTTKTASPSAVYAEVHPDVGSSQPAGGMLPNILYKLGTLSGSVTINFVTPSDANIENEYKFTFTADSTAPTITWPSGITWIGNSVTGTPKAPNVEADTYYEVSVIDNKGIFNKF